MLKRYANLGYVAVAALLAPALPLAAASHSRTSGAPTEDSYTWNFKDEASTLLADVQQEANDIVDHAEELQSFAANPDLSWKSHANQLQYVKDALNDMGGKLCRLETISPVVTPLERRELDTAVPLAVLMAKNTTEAIQFVSDHPGTLWMPAYQKYVNNLYEQSLKLDSAVKKYREYAKVRDKEERLQSELGLKTRS